MSGVYGDGNSGNGFGSQPSNNNPFSNTGASGGKSAFALPGDQYKNIASQGRYGDTMLAHITPEEAALLKSRGGAGTINPQTGLPEFHGYYQYQQMQLDQKMAAEAAAAAAKAKAAASAPAPPLTAEERQARIARDLALSQIRGARPSSQDSQFYQPAYQSQYANYTNPLTAFNVSNYGTNPGMSRSMQAATAPGAGGVDPYYRQLQSYSNVLSNLPGGANINTLLNDMRLYGISAQDLQNAYSYSPQMQTPFSYQQPMQQRQAQFNPYTNQHQTPFSYQQPSDGGMGGYGQPGQRGSAMNQRGAPTAISRAEGGIASLLDNDE